MLIFNNQLLLVTCLLLSLILFPQCHYMMFNTLAELYLIVTIDAETNFSKIALFYHINMFLITCMDKYM